MVKKHFLKLLVLFIICFECGMNVKAQTMDMINIQKKYQRDRLLYTNGYAEYMSGDDIAYGNLWNRNTEGFITRATNGKMKIEWRSEPVTRIVNGKAHFLFLICLDQANQSVNFNVQMNNKSIGSFVNFHGEDWHKKENNGVEFAFERYAATAWKDGAMFLTISIPEHMVEINKPVVFSVTGENASSNAWFILFKQKLLIEAIGHRADTDECYQIVKTPKLVEVTLPKHFIGQKLQYKLGNKNGTAQCTIKGDYALLTLPFVESVNPSFKLTDQKHLLFDFSDLNTLGNNERLDGDYFNRTIVTDNKENQTRTIVFTRKYSTAMDCFRRLSVSDLNNAEAYVMVSSHQDIAWMDSPYQCVEDRDKIIVSPALRLLEKHPDYCYDIEDGLILEEYLERHPEKRSLITRFIKEGRLGIGASYTQPYEEMQSGEALARQFYYGKRWVETNFPGASSRTYWNVDVPGRTLQMPQILKKSGVDYVMYSRHERGIYNWFSPDGSSVSVFTPGHYTVASQFLVKSPEESIEPFSEYIHSFPDYRNDKKQPARIGLLSAEDMSEAHTYFHWIDGMKKISEREKLSLPTVKHATSNSFMDALSRDKERLPKISGERPDVWLYIHGPGHERALTTYRKAERQLRAAETFSTVASLLDGSFKHYPKDDLQKAWKALIYPDHGWGGNKGFITDSLFLEKYREANKIADKATGNSLLFLSSNIRSSSKKGIPVTVFNSLSYVRSEPVSIQVNLNEIPLQSLILTDSKGKQIPYQLKDVDQKNHIAVMEFVATHVPSVGYSTFYLSKGKPSLIQDFVDSKYYKLEMKDGVLSQIIDLELNQPLFDSSKFAIGDVFTMQSVGNGAGEFSSVQKPDMAGFEQCKDALWKEISRGPVFTLYKSEKQMIDAKIIRYMKVYNQLKRIDFDTEIRDFNGKNYREFRQAFPLITKGKISYEVPFGNVTVGEDEMIGKPGERYQDEAKDIHPRGILNYLSSSSDKVGVTLSSSVVVADYIDPTDTPVDATVLQPILFASRRSCHWLGEFYSQAGDHFFHFSITSHQPSWKNGAQKAISSNTPLLAIVNRNVYRNASLPESGSFFSIDTPNIRISTIKKAEDSEDVIVRLYDWVGENKRIFIESAFDFKKLQRTSLIETQPQEVEDNTLEIGPYSIETFKLLR